MSIDAVPNGVPSGHLTIALLVAYFARRWPVGKALGALNLILTVFATLGEGEHYAFDLLAAIPFTAFLLYVSDNAFADWWDSIWRTMWNCGRMDRIADLKKNPSSEPMKEATLPDQ